MAASIAVLPVPQPLRPVLVPSNKESVDIGVDALLASIVHPAANLKGRYVVDHYHETGPYVSRFYDGKLYANDREIELVRFDPEAVSKDLPFDERSLGALFGMSMIYNKELAREQWSEMRQKRCTCIHFPHIILRFEERYAGRVILRKKKEPTCIPCVCWNGTELYWSVSWLDLDPHCHGPLYMGCFKD